jgi:hypothetical protein
LSYSFYAYVKVGERRLFFGGERRGGGAADGRTAKWSGVTNAGRRDKKVKAKCIPGFSSFF